MNINFKKYSIAFTLAETLITLGIIGIVSVTVLPTLCQKITEKQLSTSINMFNRRFAEALKIMNSNGNLAGYNSTQGFLNEFGKVFKIAKTCDNSSLEECFPNEITWGNETVDITSLKKSVNIVDDNHDWGTDVIGVQFINGISALIAYNPACRQDQFNNNLIQIGGDKDSIGLDTNNCVAMLYDITSKKKPNKVGQDIQITSNVANLGGIIANINGVLINKLTKITYTNFINCQNTTGEDYQYCYESTSYSDDRWAAAAKICKGKENLPTSSDAYNIAKYLYNNNIKNVTYTNESNNNLSQNSTHKNELVNYGFPSGSFAFWLNSGVSETGANIWIFNNTNTGSAGNARYNQHSTNQIVICVQH